MSDTVNEQAQTEAEALAAAMAGYNKEARGEQPPAEESTEQKVEQESITEEDQPEVTPEPESEPEPQPNAADLAAELKALKEKVSAASGDAETVRKLHGEIGNINRTLKQLQTQVPQKGQEEAPVDDELTAAIKTAEAAAEEYPEIAGPIVKALKALTAAKPEKAEPVNVDERVQTLVSELRQKEAIEALAEEHPDYETVRGTPEFNSWLGTKAPEYQERFMTTWNPAVVARGLTEFKEWLKAKQKKQERLAAAVVTPSVSQQAKPSTLSDEAALWEGYNSGPKRLAKR